MRFSPKHPSDSDARLCYIFHRMFSSTEQGTTGTAPQVSEETRLRRLRVRLQSEILQPENLGYLRQIAKYLMHTEVHTFAFSVAANVILSFFPFVVVMLTLTRQVFHSPGMYEVVLQVLRSYLPAGQDFIIRSVVALTPHRGMRIFSLAMLLVSSTGVFVPLEVALNHVWGFTTNRNYIANQAVSLALVTCCGFLALISVAVTAQNQWWLLWLFGSKTSLLFQAFGFLVMKLFAFVTSIAMFFVIYWLLPNGKVSAKAVLPAAVLTGFVWEVSKYLYILALRWLDFQEVYGPFALSVTLMFWAFLSGLLLLGGAQLSVLRARRISPPQI
ncbi:MAG TPA: YihY/virulence factor BrkB family protein [Terriglobales bacterium]|nr:YihY/virulence factor BrkB family protein [Terriglobales bacterium]